MLRRQRTVFAALATALAAVTLAQAPSASAQGATAPISVSVQPTQVSLAVGESTQGVLLISNSGAETVGNVHIEAVESESWFDVQLPVGTVAVDGHGSSALRFTVTRAREGTGAEGTALFVVTYTQAAGTAAPSPLVEHSLVGTLDVKGIGSWLNHAA